MYVRAHRSTRIADSIIGCAIIRAIVTYCRHANSQRRGAFLLHARGRPGREIINDNVVITSRGREMEIILDDRPIDRPPARSVAGGSREHSRTDLPPGSSRGLRERFACLPRALFYYVFQSSVGQLTIITRDVPRPRSDWRVEMRAGRSCEERSVAG